MTGRHLLAIVGLITGSVAAGSAASAWESKPFNTWTAEELKEVLTDSPWAGKGSVTRVTSRGGSSQPIEETALVTWNSALPMRQALVREQLGQNAPITKEVEAFLAQTVDGYVVAVKITGGFGATSYANQFAAAQMNTFLQPGNNKPPIMSIGGEGHVLDKDGKLADPPARGAAPGGGGAPRGGAPGGGAPAGGAPGGALNSAGQGGGAPGGGGAPPGGGGGGGRGGGGGFGGGGGRGPAGGSSLLVFAFPKTAALTAADKDVEFVTKVGNYNIKRKFHLKDMMFKGELAL